MIRRRHHTLPRAAAAGCAAVFALVGCVGEDPDPTTPPTPSPSLSDEELVAEATALTGRYAELLSDSFTNQELAPELREIVSESVSETVERDVSELSQRDLSASGEFVIDELSVDVTHSASGRPVADVRGCLDASGTSVQRADGTPIAVGNVPRRSIELSLTWSAGRLLINRVDFPDTSSSGDPCAS